MCSVHAVRKCVGCRWKQGIRGDLEPTPRRLLSAQKVLLDSLSLPQLVQAQLLQHPRHRAFWTQVGLQQRGTRLGGGVPDSDGVLDDVVYALSPLCAGPRAFHVGPLQGGGAQPNRLVFQESRLPQFVAHQHRPNRHRLI